MKIAIPVYGDSISNVFDFAHKLLIVEIEKGKEINRFEIALDNRSLPQRADKLKTLGVEVLVCGAVSKVLAGMVATSGIEVLPYVTGKVDTVLKAYMAGQLIQPEFSMPGCWFGARKGGRGRGCRWRGGRD